MAGHERFKINRPSPSSIDTLHVDAPMIRPRFTIAGISCFIVVLAIGLAALWEATEVWDSAVFGATLALLSLAALMAMHRREARRAFWFGFVVFGWTYVVVSLVPSVQARLPTTLALIKLDGMLADRAIAFTAGGVAFKSVRYTVRSAAYSTDGSTLVATGPGSIQVWSSTTGKPISVPGTTENFVRIGHSLFALVAAYLGGVLSGRLHRAETRV